jgi:hypothetical protein
MTIYYYFLSLFIMKSLTLTTYIHLRPLYTITPDSSRRESCTVKTCGYYCIVLHSLTVLQREEILLNELINLITQKTGLSNDMAQQVVQIVSGYLKDKLPEPLASQVSNVLGSQPAGSGSSQSTGDVANQGKSFLGNIFGSKGEDQPTHQ